jgi:hypothetical protein
MKDHFQLSTKQYNTLIKQGVTVKDFFDSIPLFDPYKTGSEINKVGLLYYVDEKKDFNQPPFFPHKKIALAYFENLSIKEKILVAEYIDMQENNWEEIEDEEEDD